LLDVYRRFYFPTRLCCIYPFFTGMSEFRRQDSVIPKPSQCPVPKKMEVVKFGGYDPHDPVINLIDDNDAGQVAKQDRLNLKRVSLHKAEAQGEKHKARNTRREAQGEKRKAGHASQTRCIKRPRLSPQKLFFFFRRLRTRRVTR